MDVRLVLLVLASTVLMGAHARLSSRCDIPFGQRVGCNGISKLQCSLAGCCWDDTQDGSRPERRCYEKRPVTDHPCSGAPDNCRILDQTDCALPGGRDCGMGMMKETRSCQRPNGSWYTDEVDRRCCKERCGGGGSGDPPEVTCADVFPECDPRRPEPT